VISVFFRINGVSDLKSSDNVIRYLSGNPNYRGHLWRRVARRVVIVALLVCAAISVSALAVSLFFVTRYWLDFHDKAVQKGHVEFAMSHLPPGVTDDDKERMRREFQSYFAGLYDEQNVPHLELIEGYLKAVDPALVQRK
jgi:hypothetical protein